ncbi:hypothetical protein A9Q02_06520 [Candidatus Chloroploca asiatica]|uniref:DUF11 domain-containing protein n=2 Tax=Candidatus Chloroploca asiatica TaxID=1506545 RepID=A0A2H3KFW6_9CHLR|nr:hypothetical protein A9Q02_06520 [Candidatus Chloroploca asiatica]
MWLFFILTTSLVFITASLGRTSVASARDTTDPSGSSVQVPASQPITPALNLEGYRPYLEWHNTALTAGIPRQTTVKAFVRAGEQIFIGSSVMNRLSGDVVIRAPDGTTPATCSDRADTNEFYGRIVDRAQESVGPLPAVGGFQPCIITPAETNAAGEGIWEFDFISPNPDFNIDNNPTPRLVTDEWAGSDLANHWIASWHVSVRDGTNATLQRTGRIFANYLALNMGGNASLFGAPDDLGLYQQFYILTVDGQGYRVNLNGIDPFGFIFFANAKGIVDAQGQSIYRSIQLVADNLVQSMPPGYSFHKPEDPDDLAQRNVTHKIFFDLTGPDPSMPATAQTPNGETWLLRGSQDLAPLPRNLTFVGEEGTPGQAGTNPLTGTFSFDAPADVTYEIVIDTNRNGIFTDPEDRILSGVTTAPRTSVPWDGRDQLGQRVAAGTVPVRAQVRLLGGEIHFPFIDAESNPNGMIIERVRPTFQTGDPDPFTIYYNDAYNYTGTGDYDFSPCALDDTPAPPASSGISDPTCYGRSLSPLRNGLIGVSSENGAHAWDSSAEPQFGFGDRRVIDTWTFFPSAFVELDGGVLLAEADLSIEKSHTPAVLYSGGPITYTVTVRNPGPSPSLGAPVRDEVPPEITNVTWTCALIAGTGACGQASGSGNVLSTTVDLQPNSAISFTIRGTIDPAFTGTLTNTAIITRTADTTDPNLLNNRATDVIQVNAPADLSLNKVVNNTRPNVGEVITYTITLTNAGPSNATGVTVSEPLTTELTFVSATTSVGTYDPATGIWTVGSIAANTTETLTIAARINAYSPTITNIAQVQTSDQPDPNSTPGNDDPNEDDQSSQVVRPPVADLELAKTVSAPRVNVGDSATFTITLFNRGPDPATGVTVREELPAGLEFVSAFASRGSYSNATSIWTVGNLAVNETVTLALDVIVRATGTQTNTAEVDTSDQHDPDSTPGNNIPTEDDQDSATITGDEADLSLNKVVNNTRPNVGEVITYTITLTNAGPSNATGVTVSEPLTTELTFVSATTSVGTYDPATGIWTVGSIAANTTETLTIAARINAYSPTITNIAQVQTSDQPDPNSTPGNDDPNEDDQSSQVVRPLVIDLELAHSVAILNGEERTARLVIDLLNREQCNAEPCTTATQVQVQHRIPQDLLRYVTYSTGQGTYSYEPTTGIGTWDVGTLPAGGAVQIFVDVEITAGDAEEIVSVAEVWRAIEFDIDSTPANNILAEDDQEEVRFSFLTPITLKSFTAARTSAGVAIAWETGMELDTRGFNLWRSSDGTRAGAVLITPQMIASRGSSTGGAAYQFVDTTATTDNAYAYWLVEIANNGLTSEYGPVRVARDPSNLTREHSVFLPLIVRR